MPSVKSILFTVGVTMLTMAALNHAAARFPTVRKFVRGGPVTLATNAGVSV